ncbi:MAG TPA: hypothetical protein ENJ87_07620 [Gammaproteobacteria bacterium]|nr:hypothetical protein [Gammaproteobacteria bacterium]
MYITRQKITVVIQILLYCLSANSYASERDNWQLEVAADPFSKKSVCLMISATKTTDDGQTTTPVYLIYNGTAFVARTKSNIDLSYEGSGLRVGLRNTHDIDRLLKKSSAVFDTQAGIIRDEFIRGIKATLTLGFWPTWPKTSSHKITFDLRGFTRTYEAFKHCQQTGEIF